MLDEICLAIASLVSNLEVAIIRIWRSLHTIKWYETPDCAAMETERYLKQRGVKVYGREIDKTDDDDGIEIVTIRVSRKQRKWAEEIIFIQCQKQPACKVLESTADRIGRVPKYTSRRWSGKSVFSWSPLDVAVRIMDWIF